MGGFFKQEVRIWGKIFPDRDNNLVEGPGGAGQRDWREGRQKQLSWRQAGVRTISKPPTFNIPVCDTRVVILAELLCRVTMRIKGHSESTWPQALLLVNALAMGQVSWENFRLGHSYGSWEPSGKLVSKPSPS